MIDARLIGNWRSQDGRLFLQIGPEHANVLEDDLVRMNQVRVLPCAPRYDPPVQRVELLGDDIGYVLYLMQPSLEVGRTWQPAHESAVRSQLRLLPEQGSHAFVHFLGSDDDVVEEAFAQAKWMLPYSPFEPVPQLD
jgi:hypothetical protein